MKRGRLLVVSSEFPPGPGGIGTHANQLVRHLSDRGWTTTVVTAQDYASDEEIGDFNASAAFTVERIRHMAPSALEAISRRRILARAIRKHGPQVLIATGSRSVMLVASFRRTLPWVAIGHGTEFGGRGWERAVTRWSFRRATAVVCVSHFTQRRLHRLGVFPANDSVIRNGADPTSFVPMPLAERERARRDFGMADSHVLITVGNVTERKGQEVVVSALPAICARIPNVQYWVVGLPTRGAELVSLAERLGVAPRVHVVGRVEERRLVRLLGAADLFVMPSRETAAGDVEGYGIAAVEAALCGVPSVVTDGSGLSEAIMPGETGLLVRPDDPGSLAAAVLRLLENEAQLRRMGENALARALSEQTWDKSVGKYDELLQSLVNGFSAGRQPWVNPQVGRP
jgi:phosphatidylinositol alpha-1,6-mannosyltransferase